MRKRLFSLSLFFVVLSSAVARAQFADCSTGLLQMPTAEMQQEPTFMITNNYLNQHSLATSGWDYDTFQYGFAVSFWGRVEMGYVCTIFDGRKTSKQDAYWKIMFNQDRHFTGRVALLREGDFGLEWMPGLVVGISDPTTGSTNYEYTDADVSGVGNGYFNRNFIVLTKHFGTGWGAVGVHAGYQYNRRTDYPINGPCAGVDWKPRWLHDRWLLDDLDLIVEYDSRTVNAGFIASIWDNRFEAMFEWQNFRWINFGLRYKLRIKK